MYSFVRNAFSQPGQDNCFVLLRVRRQYRNISYRGYIGVIKSREYVREYSMYRVYRGSRERVWISAGMSSWAPGLS